MSGNMSYGTTVGTRYKKKVGPSTAKRVRTGPKTEAEKEAWKKKRADSRTSAAAKRKKLESMGNVFKKVGPAVVMKFKGNKNTVTKDNISEYKWEGEK